MDTSSTGRTDVFEGDIDPALAAARYRCGHCGPRRPATARRDAFGRWHVDISHAPTCPVLAGAVSAELDIARAVGETPASP